ncbi:winged helix-turn-helix domain-containing protein [Alteromonas sp. H39]|uniref:winged helix-turn-helix domain-containing protein n=1 Tax=Alteromonas sp. H39 TaxID=3389876 RepID=UPI0039E0F3C2
MDARQETLQNGLTPIRYDAQTREITDKNHTHAWHLSKHSAALLSLFLKTEQHILTRDEIRFQIWGHDVVSDDVINHAICRLRKQLSQVETPHPFVIETLPGIGYRLTGTDVSDDMTVSARRWIVLASLFSLF